MSDSLLVSSYPVHVDDDDTKNWAPAYADLPRRLYGRAQWLYQMATGLATDGSTPSAARNPSGRYGVDHSGPPYGTAFQHVLSSWSSRGSMSSPAAFAPIVLVAGARRTVRFALVIPPHSVYAGAPYSSLRVHLIGSASTVSDKLKLTIGGRSSSTVIPFSTSTTTYLHPDDIAESPGRRDVPVTMECASGTLTITGVAIAQAKKRA